MSKQDHLNKLRMNAMEDGFIGLFTAIIQVCGPIAVLIMVAVAAHGMH